MNDKLKLAIIIGGIGLLLIGSSILYHKLTDQSSVNKKTESSKNEQSSQKEDSKKIEYMNFTVYDQDKHQVKLSDFIGKPIVINFWASWCGPCQSEMPDFEKTYQEYSDQVHFLMINLTDGNRETLDTASAFIKKHDYAFPVYFDLDLTASSTYYVSSIPQTFFIDKDGMITAYSQGAIAKEALEKQIKLLLNLK